MKGMVIQPVEGRTEEQINASLNNGMAALKEKGYTLSNPGFSFGWDDIKALAEQGIKNRDLAYLGLMIENMAKCEAVFFAKGWKDSTVCRLLHESAVTYGLTVLYEE